MTTTVSMSTIFEKLMKYKLTFSIEQHNTLARLLIEKHKGYEISFKDHSFMLAFARATDALNFSLAFQDELVRTTWPPAILGVAR